MTSSKKGKPSQAVIPGFESGAEAAQRGALERIQRMAENAQKEREDAKDRYEKQLADKRVKSKQPISQRKDSSGNTPVLQESGQMHLFWPEETALTPGLLSKAALFAPRNNHEPVAFKKILSPKNCSIEVAGMMPNEFDLKVLTELISMSRYKSVGEPIVFGATEILVNLGEHTDGKPAGKSYEKLYQSLRVLQSITLFIKTERIEENYERSAKALIDKKLAKRPYDAELTEAELAIAEVPEAKLRLSESSKASAGGKVGREKAVTLLDDFQNLTAENVTAGNRKRVAIYSVQVGKSVADMIAIRDGTLLNSGIRNELSSMAHFLWRKIRSSNEVERVLDVKELLEWSGYKTKISQFIAQTLQPAAEELANKGLILHYTLEPKFPNNRKHPGWVFKTIQKDKQRKDETDEAGSKEL